MYNITKKIKCISKKLFKMLWFDTIIHCKGMPLWLGIQNIVSL